MTVLIGHCKNGKKYKTPFRIERTTETDSLKLESCPSILLSIKKRINEKLIKVSAPSLKSMTVGNQKNITYVYVVNLLVAMQWTLKNVAVLRTRASTELGSDGPSRRRHDMIGDEDDVAVNVFDRHSVDGHDSAKVEENVIVICRRGPVEGRLSSRSDGFQRL